MERYDLKDLQKGEIIKENLTMKDVKKFVFEIMLDRSKYNNDSVAIEYREIIKNGYESISDYDMRVMLHNYKYRIIKRK